MPKVFLENGYRFFFYNNNHDPIHIHIEKDGKTAKFALNPVELMKFRRFNTSEFKQVRKLGTGEKALIIKKWNEFFNDK